MLRIWDSFRTQVDGPRGMNSEHDIENLEAAVPPGSLTIELEDGHRFSTESQRRNGVVFSKAPTQGERITEDIRSGVYECLICTDSIRWNTRMWHCNDCSKVYHTRCVRNWAQSELNSTKPYWECPNCKSPNHDNPQSRCWCHKEPYRVNDIDAEQVPNSCRQLCNKQLRCEIGCISSCIKICHPGPCGSPSLCAKHCQKLVPAEEENLFSNYNYGLSGLQNALGRPHPRGNSRRISNGAQPGLPGPHIPTFVLLAALAFAAAAGVLSWLYIRWWTEPYRYIQFARYWHYKSKLGMIFVSIVFSTGFLFVGVLPSLKIYHRAMNRCTRVHSNPCGNFMALLGIAIIGAFYVPTILFWLAGFPTVVEVGPLLAWRETMRNTCDGFDVRIRMDAGSIRKPSTDFRVYNMSVPLDEIEEVSAAPHLHLIGAPATNHKLYRLIGTQSYNPLSESEKNATIAIDIDLNKRKWAMVIPTGAWSALPDPADKIINKGSWSDTSSENPHAVFEGIPYQIPYFYNFTLDCIFEPFVKIHRTANLSEAERKIQAEQWWSKESDSTVVARTASFGYGQGELDLCVKMDDYETDGHVYPGMGENDMLVPLGIMAAYRRRRKLIDEDSYCVDSFYSDVV